MDISWHPGPDGSARLLLGGHIQAQHTFRFDFPRSLQPHPRNDRFQKSSPAEEIGEAPQNERRDEEGSMMQLYFILFYFLFYFI